MKGAKKASYSVWACILVFKRKNGEPDTAPSTPAVAPVRIKEKPTGISEHSPSHSAQWPGKVSTSQHILHEEEIVLRLAVVKMKDLLHN